MSLLRFAFSAFFLFNIVLSQEDFQCRKVYEYDASTKGEVTSPFYKDGKYPSGVFCEYKVTAPENYRIKLTFKDIDIEPVGSCGADKLVITGKDRDTVLGTFCGTEIPYPILSYENEVRLLFMSDYMVSGRGFRVQYESGPDLELCLKNEHKCRNRNCYSLEKKCDGIDDCGDGTDEESCNMPVAKPSDECGETPVKPFTVYNSADRQVGGTAAIPNSWPWQVSLQSFDKEPNSHYCGGTLISPEWVVTAAHCVQGTYNPEEIKIVLGGHNKYKKTKYEVVRVATKIIVYPDREGESLNIIDINHDIALIKLNAPVAFNNGIQPACLPHLGWEAQPGWTCYSTGWGETRGSGFDDELKQTEQIIQHQTNCSHDEQTQICVAKTHNAPCHGDSGGPLVCRLASKWYLMGATSFGTAGNLMSGLCGIPGSKVVFSKVADKGDWIRMYIDKYS